MAADAQITPVQQMISSCSGALMTSLLMTPFDVVKVRLQAQQAMASQPGQPCRVIFCNGLVDTICEVCGTPKVHYKGTIDAFMKIARIEGLTSLWRGLTPTLVMSLPQTVIYFTAYDQLRVRIQKRLPDTVTPLVAGATARLGAVTLISPLELVRTKAQSLDSGTYRDLGVSIRHMVQANGLWSLWRGLSPTLWRDVPFSAIYWGCYETIKRQVLRHRPAPASGRDFFVQAFVSGAISGMIAAIITTPFDVIKTYQQIDLTSDQPRPMLSVWRTIVAQRGHAGLFAGLLPRIAKVAPACAIMIGSYELGKAYFGAKLANQSKALEEDLHVASLSDQ